MIKTSCRTVYVSLKRLPENDTSFCVCKFYDKLSKNCKNCSSFKKETASSPPPTSTIAVQIKETPISLKPNEEPYKTVLKNSTSPNLNTITLHKLLISKNLENVLSKIEFVKQEIVSSSKNNDQIIFPTPSPTPPSFKLEKIEIRSPNARTQTKRKLSFEDFDSSNDSVKENTSEKMEVTDKESKVLSQNVRTQKMIKTLKLKKEKLEIRKQKRAETLLKNKMKMVQNEERKQSVIPVSIQEIICVKNTYKKKFQSLSFEHINKDLRHEI